ncbi:MAG: universal stress protein UspA-like protein [uncultured bacterium]|nr:MAG: universal stress protein UspA-like protein [uncultured bacterium]
MKVLFCTDGSEASFYAIKKSLPFLHTDDSIDIINIIDFGIIPTYVTFPAEEEVAYPEEKNIAQKILDKTIELIEIEGYTVNKSEYAHGKPERVILEVINTEGYDFVILGSHGKKGIRRWLGSVSRKVVTKSSIPTLIVRPPQEAENGVFIGTKEVLFAVDGSEFSYHAVKQAISILNLDNSAIEILTVMAGAESLPLEITMDNEWLQNSLRKQKEIAEEILQNTKKLFQDHNIPVKSTVIQEGDASEKILDYLEENRHDLLIMGSHGREGVSDFLLGSVSKRVLDHSISPVLIIPIKGMSISK